MKIKDVMDLHQLLRWLWKHNSETVEKLEYHEDRRVTDIREMRKALVSAITFVKVVHGDPRTSKNGRKNGDRHVIELLDKLEKAHDGKFPSLNIWRKKRHAQG